MLTILLIFALLPLLVFLGHTIQRWLFSDAAVKLDAEWELYQQRWD